MLFKKQRFDDWEEVKKLLQASPKSTRPESDSFDWVWVKQEVRMESLRAENERLRRDLGEAVELLQTAVISSDVLPIPHENDQWRQRRSSFLAKRGGGA